MTRSPGGEQTQFWSAGLCAPTLELRLQDDADGAVRATLIGELDLVAADRIREELEELVRATTCVRLDLSQLEFIDCAGLGGILGALSDARRTDSRLEVDPIVSPSVGRIAALTDMGSALWPGEVASAAAAAAQVSGTAAARMPGTPIRLKADPPARCTPPV